MRGRTLQDKQDACESWETPGVSCRVADAQTRPKVWCGFDREELRLHRSQPFSCADENQRPRRLIGVLRAPESADLRDLERFQTAVGWRHLERIECRARNDLCGTREVGHRFRCE